MSVDVNLAASAARDGEEFTVDASGTNWTIAWYPPPTAPPGANHGANGFCVTADRDVVLISDDGERWGWPGGRPEDGESWEQTLRREVLEESCSTVTSARLLGFSRAVGIEGPEQGKVLVRSLWLALVDVMQWKPQFEIQHRRLVPSVDLMSILWMEPGFEPLYYRAIIEAELAA